MAETANYSHLARHATVATRRTLTWVEEPRFQGCGCSECAWVFKPAGPPVGNSLDEMREHFERLRDKEFATHICAEHPRAKKAKG
jgi:hypothetical protein